MRFRYCFCFYIEIQIIFYRSQKKKKRFQKRKLNHQPERQPRLYFIFLTVNTPNLILKKKFKGNLLCYMTLNFHSASGINYHQGKWDMAISCWSQRCFFLSQLIKCIPFAAQPCVKGKHFKRWEFFEMTKSKCEL